MALTPAQCRAARGLLGVSQQELATATKVGLASVKRFEGEQTKMRRDQLGRLEAFLAEKGLILIEFTVSGTRAIGVAQPIVERLEASYSAPRTAK